MAQNLTSGGLRHNLYREVLQVMESGVDLDDELFDDLAMRIFRYQLSTNNVYRGYFEASRINAPKSWQHIPALPAAAFKRGEVRAYPPEAVMTWFQTSGTTSDESGRHYFETLELYETAILPPFKKFLLPDRERMRMVILTPPPADMPHSSLVHMMETVKNHYGTHDSQYSFTVEGILLNEFVDNLQDATARQQPVFLLGTAFAFAHALEILTQQGIRFNLPFGSRIMETGGFKGRTREIPRAEFYAMLSEAFTIPLFNIVNEYGMTELSSQFYDRSLLDQRATDWKSGPTWCRIAAVSPETGQPVPEGEAGLLRIYDLANVGSTICLQTEDVGIVNGDGDFKVFGRVATAPLRGCSLSTEKLLT